MDVVRVSSLENARAERLLMVVRVTFVVVDLGDLFGEEVQADSPVEFDARQESLLVDRDRDDVFGQLFGLFDNGERVSYQFGQVSVDYALFYLEFGYLVSLVGLVRL